MSKPKHTPLERLKHHCTGAIERGEKRAIEAVAGPNLRAAAPEMFETMNMLASELVHQEKHGQRPIPQWLVDQYARTLAKARGES